MAQTIGAEPKGADKIDLFSADVADIGASAPARNDGLTSGSRVILPQTPINLGPRYWGKLQMKRAGLIAAALLLALPAHTQAFKNLAPDMAMG
ncbi:MAG: hypothetical protein AAFY37_14745, partial [Pseudomonadota bacterium]